MPRGIPKSGVRKNSTGRPKKYSSELVKKWVPKTVASSLDNAYQMLNDLEDEVSKWEKVCAEKSTSPRYEQARKLTNTLRTMLNSLGFNPKDIYVESQQENNEEKE